MSLKHAIIALLDLEKGTGYDLVKRFNSSIGHFWSSSHQQVYQELGKLSDEGLVEFETVEQSGKPDKKVYHVTAAGTASLRAWLNQPAKGFKYKDPLLIKLFAGNNTSKNHLLDELQTHQSAHESTLRDYERIEALLVRSGFGEKRRYLLPYLTMRLGIRIEKAWLEWVEEVREALRDLP
jgi:PadR family transcriptional regulator AphA